MNPLRFPEGAYVEDGLLIVGDEAWTPAEVAMEVRQDPVFSRVRNAIWVRRWRAKNPERARELRRREADKRRAA